MSSRLGIVVVLTKLIRTRTVMAIRLISPEPPIDRPGSYPCFSIGGHLYVGGREKEDL